MATFKSVLLLHVEFEAPNIEAAESIYQEHLRAISDEPWIKSVEDSALMGYSVKCDSENNNKATIEKNELKATITLYNPPERLAEGENGQLSYFEKDV